jgi:ATP-dependent RNA circularization protein (DNA/RNA ligase family)
VTQHKGTTYPKIETLFDRDERFVVDTERLRRAEFELIREWVLTEKVDGTNVRVIFTRREDYYDIDFDVRGKTDSAQMPPQLLNTLRGWCEDSTAEVRKIMDEFGLSTYVLYGEGYGPKIQSGGRYRTDQGFILFDVAANGGWLDESQVTGTAERLGLARVPTITVGPIDAAVELVRSGFASDVADEFDATFHAEGVVAKTAVPLYDRRGERLMWKLKAKDFRAGKR